MPRSSNSNNLETPEKTPEKTPAATSTRLTLIQHLFDTGTSTVVGELIVPSLVVNRLAEELDGGDPTETRANETSS